jgi:hypothetical protein
MEKVSAISVLGLALIASNGARAEDVLLSCWGTVELIQQGKQVNVQDERSSIAVAVDVAKKTVTINGISWSISDVSRETIVVMDDKGSVSLNRITGAVNVHFIELNGLKKFYGECKPAQKLF